MTENKYRSTAIRLDMKLNFTKLLATNSEGEPLMHKPLRDDVVVAAD